MSHWTHHNPVRIIAGKNCLVDLPQLLPADGSCWLLVTTEGFTRRGMTARLKVLASGVEVKAYDRVTPNPELDELEARTGEFRNHKFQGIIALGGGSVLDAAKVLAVALASELEHPLTQTLREGQRQNWQHKLPLIAIPTTSGTGAEVTPFATVWDQNSYKKYSVTGDKVYPDTALLDPTLILTLPHDETLFTGLDTISHALESLWNKNKTPLSEAWAWQALALANEALPYVLEEPDNLIQREKMQQASLMSGLAISQTRTAIAHSISYPLTCHYGVPHGLACSFTLPTLITMAVRQGILYESPLLKQLQVCLTNLNLNKKIVKYASTQAITALQNEMHTPGRTDNCVIDEITTSSILTCSLQ
jgi:alcohol dehydrogenase